MIRFFTIFGCTLLFSSLIANAQTYDDHFGTGNNIGVSITSSSSTINNNAEASVSGTELIPDLTGAARFLAQATFGANQEDIEYVTQIGIDNWIDEQTTMPIVTKFETDIRAIHMVANQKIINSFGADAVQDSRYNEFVSYAFYQKALKEDDQLRQKSAFALSQILVNSFNNGNQYAYAHGSYYDLLYEGAFGNFRDLLYNVSLHPMMGLYLSSYQNRKADPETGTLPDENYAREIMQLFTIGLFELNNDGTQKLDNNGEVIPTYDIIDVQELAKVFTGLSGGAFDYDECPTCIDETLTFTKGKSKIDLTKPMIIFEDYHETSQKILPDGTIIPANQTGLQDVNDVIDWLFNHPNVGPFIGYRLIQQLIKSNPTPAYINRVAMAFNNDGNGVRGNMEAVFRAILTDSEARDCSWIDDPTTGKLLQPIERFTNAMIAFDIESPSGLMWFRDHSLIYGKLEQAFLFAPSVFNFYSPFYAVEGEITENNMVSPEFQILHSTSTIHYINEIEDVIKDEPFRNRTGVNSSANGRLNYDSEDYPYLDFSTEVDIYNNYGLTALFEHLNLLICRGQMQTSTQVTIETAMNEYLANSSPETIDIVHEVLFMIMTSPNYVILK